MNEITQNHIVVDIEQEIINKMKLMYNEPIKQTKMSFKCAGFTILVTITKE